MQKFLLAAVVLFSYIYAKDNYVFDAQRIKKVFCGWELTKEEIDKNHFLKVYNKQKDIYIDISDYEKGDTPKIAEKRFYQQSLKEKYQFIRKNEESKEILGQISNEFARNYRRELVRKNQLFFDKVKMSIVSSNGTSKDYLETLELIKEAITPNAPIKKRQCLGELKYYKLEDFFDIKELEKNIKQISSTGKFEKVREAVYESTTLMDEYAYLLDKGGKLQRGIALINNKNFSKEVIAKQWEKSVMLNNIQDQNELKPKYLGEDKLSEKYFGVSAQTHALTGYKQMGAMAYQSVIITDNYTIVLHYYMLQGNKEAMQRDYENLLQAVYLSLKT
ncbi:hypothetical protein B6S12_03690 [Helicobacter valdiviensis]|uniref:Uncharacterized protein n=1 Tax=Helicobacter valdiviensis TaxID=1458358 RepID=A0A2W6MX01_9HELI|nr:hypothetical protein [Helicobacter valdiviensis]PZT48441.1 hypothetical protein B6S12_03690 [Helicobacter valdiviensis]